MTKKDIIEKIAPKAGISKAAAERAVNACLDQIRQELEKGNKVRLRGFGGFSVKKVAARRCRHPQTGELIDVAAQGRVRFSAGRELKDSLDEGEARYGPALKHRAIICRP
jgi:DNA-binding protein HU-beta